MTPFQWAMLVFGAIGAISATVANIILAVKGGIVIGKLIEALQNVTETLKDHGTRLINLEQK